MALTANHIAELVALWRKTNHTCLNAISARKYSALVLSAVTIQSNHVRFFKSTNIPVAALTRSCYTQLTIFRDRAIPVTPDHVDMFANHIETHVVLPLCVLAVDDTGLQPLIKIVHDAFYHLWAHRGTMHVQALYSRVHALSHIPAIHVVRGTQDHIDFFTILTHYQVVIKPVPFPIEQTSLITRVIEYTFDDAICVAAESIITSKDACFIMLTLAATYWFDYVDTLLEPPHFHSS